MSAKLLVGFTVGLVKNILHIAHVIHSYRLSIDYEEPYGMCHLITDFLASLQLRMNELSSQAMEVLLYRFFSFLSSSSSPFIDKLTCATHLQWRIHSTIVTYEQ